MLKNWGLKGFPQGLAAGADAVENATRCYLDFSRSATRHWRGKVSPSFKVRGLQPQATGHLVVQNSGAGDITAAFASEMGRTTVTTGSLTVSAGTTGVFQLFFDGAQLTVARV